MDLSLFDYELPRELIAQFPTRRRSASRLLVLDRKTGERRHLRFTDLPDYLEPDDCLVVNNTKVFKARLLGRRATGGRVEVFLVRPADLKEPGGRGRDIWIALVSPTRRLNAGERITFDSRSNLELLEHRQDGEWLVAFSSKTARERTISRFGRVPLPHYIDREDQPADVRRYQTVFAAPDRVGAVAAPTAGFHFTPSLLAQIKDRGVTIVEVTLHVGPGTFKPIKADRIEDHIVDPEYAELTPKTAEQINAARAAGGRIIVVGTTSVRTLESAAQAKGDIRPFSGMVDLYIRPGHRFRAVDHLITNFHLPRSSLLVLVSAFAGREQILSAYEDAIARKYRFYSYGDAMLIR